MLLLLLHAVNCVKLRCNNNSPNSNESKCITMENFIGRFTTYLFSYEWKMCTHYNKCWNMYSLLKQRWPSLLTIQMQVSYFNWKCCTTLHISSYFDHLIHFLTVLWPFKFHFIRIKLNPSTEFGHDVSLHCQKYRKHFIFGKFSHCNHGWLWFLWCE